MRPGIRLFNRRPYHRVALLQPSKLNPSRRLQLARSVHASRQAGHPTRLVEWANGELGIYVRPPRRYYNAEGGNPFRERKQLESAKTPFGQVRGRRAKPKGTPTPISFLDAGHRGRPPAPEFKASRGAAGINFLMGSGFNPGHPINEEWYWDLDAEYHEAQDGIIEDIRQAVADDPGSFKGLGGQDHTIALLNSFASPTVLGHGYVVIKQDEAEEGEWAEAAVAAYGDGGFAEAVYENVDELRADPNTELSHAHLMNWVNRQALKWDMNRIDFQVVGYSDGEDAETTSEQQIGKTLEAAAHFSRKTPNTVFTVQATELFFNAEGEAMGWRDSTDNGCAEYYQFAHFINGRALAMQGRFGPSLDEWWQLTTSEQAEFDNDAAAWLLKTQGASLGAALGSWVETAEKVAERLLDDEGYLLASYGGQITYHKRHRPESAAGIEHGKVFDGEQQRWRYPVQSTGPPPIDTWAEAHAGRPSWGSREVQPDSDELRWIKPRTSKITGRPVAGSKGTRRNRRNLARFIYHNPERLATSSQLFDYINSGGRAGDSASALGNLLSGDPRFRKVGYIRQPGNKVGGGRVTAVWTLTEPEVD
jgi:hypothetical protein